MMDQKNRLLLLVVVSCLLPGHFVASSSQMCDNESRICAGDEVECEESSGQCTCVDQHVGVPHLGCFHKKFKFCSLLNDPKGSTFAREPHVGIEIALPCQFLAAHFTAESDGKYGNYAFCDVKVYAAERRFKGRFYVSGFAVEISFTRFIFKRNLDTSGILSLRAHASADQDNYSYTLERRMSPDGPWSSDPSVLTLDDMDGTLPGVNEFVYQAGENRVALNVEMCGLELFFRPGDSSKKVQDQTSLPGLIIGANQGNYAIRYKSHQKAFCLTSRSRRRSVADVTEALDLSNEEAFLFRAFAAQSPQDFPGIASQACVGTSSVVKQCKNHPNMKTAMEECSFIMLEPHFVNCYSRRSDSRDLVLLFKKCMKSYCKSQKSACIRAKERIARRGCTEHASLEFMGFDCHALES